MPPQLAAKLAEMKAKQAELAEEVTKANKDVECEKHKEEVQLEKEKQDMQKKCKEEAAWVKKVAEAKKRQDEEDEVT